MRQHALSYNIASGFTRPVHILWAMKYAMSTLVPVSFNDTSSKSKRSLCPNNAAATSNKKLHILDQQRTAGLAKARP